MPEFDFAIAERISIHAPRTGSDHAQHRSGRQARDFNPRSPYGERPLCCQAENGSNVFQSTLPAIAERISIHAPRTGSDKAYRESPGFRHLNFNPRSPHGERLRTRTAFCHLLGISIHAPRTGSDPKGEKMRRPTGDFNPRSPHGERQLSGKRRELVRHFNPRSPHGERRAP